MSQAVKSEISLTRGIVGTKALHAVRNGVACYRRCRLVIAYIAITRCNSNPTAVWLLDVTALPPIIIPASAPLALRGNNGTGGRTNPSPDSCAAATARDATNDGPGCAPKDRTAERVLSRRLLDWHGRG